MTLTVGIYLFDEVEVLDFAGPFEVFSTANRMHARRSPDAPPPFSVSTLAGREPAVRARGGLAVRAGRLFDDAMPDPDVLILPGGDESGELGNERLLARLRRLDPARSLLASVCTGAFLLAAAGHLAGRRATTHHEDLARLRRDYADVDVVEGVRWVDEDRVVTSAGVAAGIDMSLHLVARLVDDDLALATARNMAVSTGFRSSTADRRA